MTLQSVSGRAVWMAVAVASVGAIVLVAGSIDSSPETVVLDWAFDRILAFVRWVAEYLVARGVELTADLLDWLREQWERFTASSS